MPYQSAVSSSTGHFKTVEPITHLTVSLNDPHHFSPLMFQKLFTCSFPAKIACSFLDPTCTTCPDHLILHYLVTLKVGSNMKNNFLFFPLKDSRKTPMQYRAIAKNTEFQLGCPQPKIQHLSWAVHSQKYSI